MKKILTTMGITSIIMLIVIGVLVWRTSKISNDLSAANEEKEAQERDLLSADGKKAIDDIEERKVVPLYLNGLNKNVLTYKKEKQADIYNVEKSAQIAEQLGNMKEIGEYTFEKALLAYNPFGTYENSLYMSFHTSKKSYVRYTITVEDDTVPDFTRTCLNTDDSAVAKDHEFTVIGLVAGMKNYIVMELYGNNDEVLDTMIYSIDVPESPSSAAVKLAAEEGRSKEVISNGLYAVYGNMDDGAKKAKNKKNAITLYDNSGILRGEIPLIGYRGDGITYVYDNIAYACAKNQIVQVSARGQVMHIHDLGGYTQGGGYTYDGNGNLYVIASKDGRKTVNDVVLEVGLTTGETSEVLDFTKLLDKVAEAAKPVKGEKKLDWIGLNGIQVTDVNQILVSSRELSSIIKVNNIHSEIPSVSYILADKAIWKASTNKSRVLDKSYKEGEEPEQTESPVDSILETKPEKEIVFDSQFGQCQIAVEKSSSLAEGQYYLYVLNNNYGEWKTRPAFSFSRFKGIGTKDKPAKNSYYYRFIVDETARTYYLDESVKLPYISHDGSVQRIKEHYVVACSDDDKFMEFDKNGKILTSYDFGKKIYKIEKEDWKSFWFQ